MAITYFCEICNQLFKSDGSDVDPVYFGFAKYAVCFECALALSKGEKIEYPGSPYDGPRILQVPEGDEESEFDRKKEELMHMFDSAFYIKSEEVPKNIQSKIRAGYALIDSDVKEKIAQIFETDIFALDQYISTNELILSVLFKKWHELLLLREAEEKQDDEDAKPQSLEFIEKADDSINK